ncbi:MAG: Fur family transcriptional regulator [Acidimicrobiia bacterium]|nr:Fur family transcriptional regulator [Acidimicrobiia bacterium]
MRSPTELAERLRADGLKVTPQRQLLFRLLADGAEHPTADSLYEQASAEMPGISLRTVYTTLTDLTDMGEVTAISLGQGPMRFDTNTEHHHHLVCEHCNSVRDVYVEGFESLTVEPLDGFEPTDASIVFGGRCASCVGAPVPQAP